MKNKQGIQIRRRKKEWRERHGFSVQEAGKLNYLVSMVVVNIAVIILLLNLPFEKKIATFRAFQMLLGSLNEKEMQSVCIL